MILVDTSVWIDHLRGATTDATTKLFELWSLDIPAALTPSIVQELLQGTASSRDFSDLEDYLRTQPLLGPRDLLECHVAAARMYRECRRIGRTIRSSNDCLIAQVAIDNDVPLLHSDADFDQIAMVAPLRIF